jgi:cytochrome c
MVCTVTAFAVMLGLTLPALADNAMKVAMAGKPPAGNAAKGETVFMRCALCHNANKGGGNGLGPNLFGVVGRKAASLPGFYYSPALKKSGITWTDNKLAAWLAHPQKLVPGTRMAFAGLSNQKDIEDVIAFLKSRK